REDSELLKEERLTLKLRQEKNLNTMLIRWMFLYQKGLFAIGSYLRFFGYQNIAVYSAPPSSKKKFSLRDAVDTLLIQELNSDTEITLSCIISDSQRTLDRITTIKPSELSSDVNIDAIIVPTPHYYRKVKKQFSKNYPVIALDRIIYTLFCTEINDMCLIRKLVELKERGVQVLTLGSAYVDRIKNPSEFEQLILSGLKEREQPEIFYRFYKAKEQYSFEEYFNTLKATFQPLPYRNYWHYVNKQSDIANIANFKRLNTDAPDCNSRVIHLFGDSTTLGFAIEDRFTVANTLQRLVNEREREKTGGGVRVIDYSMGAANTRILANRIADTKIDSRDTVVVVRRNGALTSVFSRLMSKNHLFYYDTQPDFERPHSNGEVFRDRNHFNYRGTQKMAQIVFRVLAEQEAYRIDKGKEEEKKSAPVSLFSSWNRLQLEIPTLEEYAIDAIVQSSEFRQYIERLNSLDIEKTNKNGAIVMNCNPFTRGHQYLVETCARKVDRLFIFAVEEDRSIFSFVDRFELIKAGVKHLDNVEVLPSGNFIISTLTFPEYFEKDDLQEAIINPSNDIELFGKHIAPALGIKIRFAGEEPLDKVTLQYNQAMEDILPSFGIEFEVIPRIEENGEPISASRVRNLLVKNDFDSIEKLVPPSTLDYLIKRKALLSTTVEN
ncbi:MAG: hypothetical protein FWF91_03910, partial [Coriobacteriia bacterium]|nr:hypothetical protein [Coriobacteriia bacterium]